MKRKIPVGRIVLILAIVAFVSLIFYNKNKDFGLSREAKNLERQLTAEETIRLYFYYCNRRDASADSLVLDNSLADNGDCQLLDSTPWFDDVAWLFKDICLIEVNELLTKDQPNDLGVYQEKAFQVIYNVNYFKATKKESDYTVNTGFVLVREEQDSAWEIIIIGNG